MSANRNLTIAEKPVLSPHTNTNDFFKRLYEVLLMTIQKANNPSVHISPAVIGLTLSLVIQTVFVVWWAASIQKETEKNAEVIKEMKSVIETQKVYIDNAREKFIKMETVVEAIQRQQQLENLVKQKEGK